MKILIQFVLCLGLPALLFAQSNEKQEAATQLLSSLQKQGNIWYFGTGAGLSFKNGEPIPLTDGRLQTQEGCATICNPKGELLFYTDGIHVWDQNHALMRNGTHLGGDPSSTQSGVIVPQPLDSNKYYIFTVDDVAGANGFQFALVDMSLQNGIGEVLVKNEQLLKPTVEKVTAVRHANKQDIWVITHLWNSDAFYAYLITDEGIQLEPIVSNIGQKQGGYDIDNAIGYMKASPDGSKLALAYWGNLNGFELFDFDDETGKVTNPHVLKFFPSAYGVEFSPDSRFLYGSTYKPGKVYQFDLSLKTAKQLIDSAIVVAKPLDNLGGMQIGPDGRIYVSRSGSTWLGVINHPNLKGKEACYYQDDGVFLDNRKAQLGLPTFIQSYFEQETGGQETITIVERESESEQLNSTGIDESLNSPPEEMNIDLPDVITLGDVLFETNKWALRAEAEDEIAGVVAILRENPSLQAWIVGYTDSRGTNSYNLELSFQRAKSVRAALIEAGIDEGRLLYKGEGEKKPVATNATKEGMQRNRRVEVWLRGF